MDSNNSCYLEAACNNRLDFKIQKLFLMSSTLIIALSLILGVANCALVKVSDQDKITKAITSDLVDRINAMGSTWTATYQPRFATAMISDVKVHLGAILPGEPGYTKLPSAEEVAAANRKLDEMDLKAASSSKNPTRGPTKKPTYAPSTFAPSKTRVPSASPTLSPTKSTLTPTWSPATVIPTSFDVRTNWPQCAVISGRIRDQSACGSCWAFAAVAAFNDRHCIKTGDNTTVFSAADVTSCCSAGSGCNGGDPSGTWKWFVNTGVVTGGDYGDIGTGTTCDPYLLAPCVHHVTPPPGQSNCPANEYTTPACSAPSCTETNYSVSYSNDKHKASTSYSVGSSVTQIQKEIMSKGSVTATFTVYSDFLTYSSGVYQHLTGSQVGGHAVKMIGWGVTTGGVAYWICANQWDTTWGQGGIFYILRGVNECGIEGGISAGDA